VRCRSVQRVGHFPAFAPFITILIVADLPRVSPTVTQSCRSVDASRIYSLAVVSRFLFRPETSVFRSSDSTSTGTAGTTRYDTSGRVRSVAQAISIHSCRYLNLHGTVPGTTSTVFAAVYPYCCCCYCYCYCCYQDRRVHRRIPTDQSPITALYSLRYTPLHFHILHRTEYE